MTLYSPSDYDDHVIFTALGGEYKAEQNRCCELGVLPTFHSKAFLKIHEYPSADDFKGKKRLHGVYTAWFIVKWFTVADFLSLEPMFTTTEENEVALSLFSDFGIFSQDQF